MAGNLLAALSYAKYLGGMSIAEDPWGAAHWKRAGRKSTPRPPLHRPGARLPWAGWVTAAPGLHPAPPWHGSWNEWGVQACALPVSTHSLCVERGVEF